MLMIIPVFCDMKPCRSVYRYQSFGEVFCSISRVKFSRYRPEQALGDPEG
jgi:hypothetical protein